MNRLEQIKDEYAEKHHAHDWESFVRNQVSWWVEAQMDDVCKIYAEECCKATLKEVSKKAVLRIISSNSDRNHKERVDTINGLWGTYNEKTTVDKESITNPENIVLL